MGEYEPRDSRDVTLQQDRAPGEPPRTGPREGETRQPQTELDDDGRGDEPEQTVSVEQQAEQREESMQRDTEELNAADAARGDRND